MARLEKLAQQEIPPARAGASPAASQPHRPILRERLEAPIDLASLALFRICFGGLMLWHILQYLLGGRLEREYLTPVFFFKYPGFEWVHVGSRPVMILLFTGLAAAAVLIALGLFYRLAVAAFFLGITYVFLLDAADYQNHIYLLCLLSFLMIWLPLHRAFSLDARRKPALRSETAPAWVLWLLRFQVALPYFFGGVAKLNADWLLRAQPMRLWMGEGTEGSIARLLPPGWGSYAMSWGGVLFDLGVVPALLWRRTRIPALLLAVAFHLTNSMIFSIGIFPWLMIAAALLFLPPDWPRRAYLLQARATGRKARRKDRPTGPMRASGTTYAFLAAWVAVQLLLPLRHFLYPGNVDWTEEGHRFSWRMKLRDKRGSLSFLAVDPASKRAIALTGVEAALTPDQRDMMIHDPDMMRQFAHFVTEQLREAGHGHLEVRVESSLSLNQRPRQEIVDPKVDLAAQEWSLAAAHWILPLRPLRERGAESYRSAR
jgi:vitamin K-dependent gamma-carboxylase